jgi:hypothetical protein
MVPPPGQYTVGVCHQITLLILYYIFSVLVILLEITDPSLQVSDVSFKFMNYYLHVICCSYYLNCFGLDPVTTAV